MSLSPAQRVQQIKEIVRRLSAEEWPLMDVTLRQFSLPTSDGWHGNKDAYIVEMIEHATDEVLTDLAGHLGFVLDEPTTRIELAFWRRGYFRLFISHLAKHRKEAAALQEKLTGFAVTSFVAHNDIAPSAEWQNEIEAALATADCLVAMLHPGFHASKWTDQEIGYAMGRSLPVFSVRLGEDPYGFIGRFQAFQGTGKDAADLATELFDVLGTHKQTRRRIAEALLLRLEESDSFSQAKSNMGLLEKATYWHPSFAERLRLAARTNGQIQGPSAYLHVSSNWSTTVVPSASDLLPVDSRTRPARAAMRLCHDGSRSQSVTSTIPGCRTRDVAAPARGRARSRARGRDPGRQEVRRHWRRARRPQGETEEEILAI